MLSLLPRRSKGGSNLDGWVLSRRQATAPVPDNLMDAFLELRGGVPGCRKDKEPSPTRHSRVFDRGVSRCPDCLFKIGIIVNPHMSALP